MWGIRSNAVSTKMALPEMCRSTNFSEGNQMFVLDTWRPFRSRTITGKIMWREQIREGWGMAEGTQGRTNPKKTTEVFSPHSHNHTVTSELPHTHADRWSRTEVNAVSLFNSSLPSFAQKSQWASDGCLSLVQLCWMVLDARTGGFVCLLSASVWSSPFAHTQRVHWGNSCQKSRKIILISSKVLFCFFELVYKTQRDINFCVKRANLSFLSK